jgi:hypothetical protein
MSNYEEVIYDSDDGALVGTLIVEVVDWWMESPLQGVPVRVASSKSNTRGQCPGCYQSTLTDDRGIAMFRVKLGMQHVHIPPDFDAETFVGPGQAQQLRFECPDFVKKVRHGFDNLR